MIIFGTIMTFGLGVFIAFCGKYDAETDPKSPRAAIAYMFVGMVMVIGAIVNFVAMSLGAYTCP